MATVNITEAAKMVGLSRSYFHRKYIKTGVVSCIGDSNKNKQIETSDLLRVFGKLDKNDSDSTMTSEHHVTMTKNSSIDAAYSAAIDALNETIAAKDALIEDKEKTIGEYKARLAKSENLLTDQRSEADKAKAALKASQDEKLSRRWWRFWKI